MSYSESILAFVSQISPQLAKRFRAYGSISRERVALARLTDAALDDIGITRSEAEKEVNRLFWDAPTHWIRWTR